MPDQVLSRTRFGHLMPVADRTLGHPGTAPRSGQTFAALLAGDAAALAEDQMDEANLTGSGPEARARRRELARCAHIFDSPAAKARPDLAAQIAFGTRIGRHAARRALEDAVALASYTRGNVETRGGHKAAAASIIQIAEHALGITPARRH